MSVCHLIYGPIYAGTMVAAQYLACLCNIAAYLSGFQEVAELAHSTDTYILGDASGGSAL